jgi:hypothetical protein
LVQAPLAVALSEREGEIAFPAYETYRASVESFFVHHPLIHVYALPPYQPGWMWGGAPEEVFAKAIHRAGLNGTAPIRLGIYRDLRVVMPDFSQTFYKDARIPYVTRFEKCPIKEAAKLVRQVPPVFPNERKIFLHDDPRRNFRITRLVPNGEITFRPKPEESHLSVLRYARAIYEAREIHVIDSAFFWLVNALLTGSEVKAKLYFHAYVRWPHDRHFRYESRIPWEYLLP